MLLCSDGNILLVSSKQQTEDIATYMYKNTICWQPPGQDKPHHTAGHNTWNNISWKFGHSSPLSNLVFHDGIVPSDR